MSADATGYDSLKQENSDINKQNLTCSSFSNWRPSLRDAYMINMPTPNLLWGMLAWSVCRHQPSAASQSRRTRVRNNCKTTQTWLISYHRPATASMLFISMPDKIKVLTLGLSGHKPQCSGMEILGAWGLELLGNLLALRLQLSIDFLQFKKKSAIRGVMILHIWMDLAYI